MKAALAFLAFLLAGFVPAGAAAPPFDPFQETGIDALPDARAPMNMRFQDEGARTVTLAQAGEGRPILLVPVLHDCPNICEVTLEGMAQAIRAQPFRPGRDFTLVAFGIAARERPEAARATHRRLAKALPFPAGGGVHALPGTQAALHAVADALPSRSAFNP